MVALCENTVFTTFALRVQNINIAQLDNLSNLYCHSILFNIILCVQI